MLLKRVNDEILFFERNLKNKKKIYRFIKKHIINIKPIELIVLKFV